MIARVISALDGDTWRAALSLAGCDDPYFHADYHLAYAHDGGSSWLYAYHDGTDALAYPFRLHPIMGAEVGWHDMETVYGYTGPVATCADPDFLRAAWAGLAEWVAENRVVSEFCRFHPLLATQRFAAPEMTVLHDRDTIVIDLGGDEDTLWAGYKSAQRNMVRKAVGHGLTCHSMPLEDGLDWFRALYDQTMTGLNAGEFYFFPPEYYHRLAALGDGLAAFAVLHEDQPIAGALFLRGADTVHYHLSGSLFAHRKLAPNNLLLHTVAQWAQHTGARQMFLGGGRTNQPDDDLLAFKRSFAPSGAKPFHFGKRIWHAQMYQRLSEEWCAKAGRTAPAMLQHYRTIT